MLIEFTSESCGWCRALERDTHSDAAIASVLNERFVPVRPRGAGVGALREQFKVSGTPHTLIITADDAPVLIHRIRGYMPPPVYQAELDTALRRWQQYGPAPQAMEQLAAGVAELGEGERAKAVATLSELVQQFPRGCEAYRVRARAHRELGDLNAALEDYNSALELTANDGWLYFYRGGVHYDLGNFKEAQHDYYESARHLRGHADYSVIRLWLCSARLGKQQDATDFVQLYMREGGRNSRGMNYPARQLRYLSGDADESTLMGDDRWRPQKWQRLSAHFTIGSRALAEGDRDKAVEHLKKAVQLGPVAMSDYDSAVIELERLNE